MFDQGLTVLRIRGIPIRLHITLLIFLPYIAYLAASQFSVIAMSLGLPREAMRLPPLAWGAILAVGLFVAVLAHELAHSFVALKNGVKVRSITLMMLGGVSWFERDDPEHEAWMAFAGPLMSFGIALASYVAFRLVPAPTELGAALLAFAITNAILGVFNLLPAFPMDGGRVLRGLLLRRVGRARATRIATAIGKVMAVIFGLLGLLSWNFILVLIAVFVYMGASAEQARSSTRDMIRGIPIARFMTDRLGEAYADESPRAVAERLLRDNLVGARVMDDPHDGEERREIGVVTVWDLARQLERGVAPVTVGAVMPVDVPRARASDDASRSIEALASGEASAVAVLDEGEHVIGIVTPAEIQRALALAGALGGLRAGR
ncbi:neutral zinc metallopeptidase [Sorangium cellulosum]|jgi:Zn-dependent protease/CBS domain-containing protein|uniref:Zinc metalloprotease n=1 Tax=Sorangium cellulosum TaxID=56 RepID=A0A4P2QAR3_SORCE|nr:site-2 protease family protein [Sorangium cellulosum]AUX26679.1 neutral zinc metallopeptidase [Sorangium cellulosum]